MQSCPLLLDAYESGRTCWIGQTDQNRAYLGISEMKLQAFELNRQVSSNEKVPAAPECGMYQSEHQCCRNSTGQDEGKRKQAGSWMRQRDNPVILLHGEQEGSEWAWVKTRSWFITVQVVVLVGWVNNQMSPAFHIKHFPFVLFLHCF